MQLGGDWLSGGQEMRGLHAGFYLEASVYDRPLKRLVGLCGCSVGMVEIFPLSKLDNGEHSH